MKYLRHHNKNKHIALFGFIVLGLFLLAGCGVPSRSPKYVFLFIGDGMGSNQIHAAEMFAGVSETDSITSQKMCFSQFPVVGLMANPSQNRFITDSAASGTAMASGYKTINGRINIDQTNKIRFKPITAAAKEKGMKVGIISNVSLDHATPASFYAQVSQRSMYYDIALQMSECPFDFFGGGGLLYPRGRKNSDPDAVEIIKKKGFHFVDKKEEFLSLKPDNRRIVAFNEILDTDAAMPYEIDRNTEDLSLAAFVHKSLELLDNENGFFLMVEGGKIDWACHDNDGATTVREVLAFNEAVMEAVHFYERHPDETLIIVTADHETGSLNLVSDSAASPTSIALLAFQKMSLDLFSDTVLKPYWSGLEAKKPTLSDLMPIIEDYFGLRIMPRDEREELSRKVREGDISAHRKIELSLSVKEREAMEKALAAGRRTFEDIVIRILDNKAGLSWGSGGHSAALLPVFAIGRGEESFGGVYENTDIAKKLAVLMELELDFSPLQPE